MPGMYKVANSDGVIGTRRIGVTSSHTDRKCSRITAGCCHLRVLNGWMTKMLVVFVFFALRITYIIGNPETRDQLLEICQSEFFTANCTAASGAGANDVIMIESGQFGRMRPGRCLPDSHGQFECTSDVTWYLDRRCTGSRQCKVYAGEPVLLKSVTTCSRGLASYLEAKYTCIAAAPGRNLKAAEDECVNNRQILLLVGSEGDGSDRKSSATDGERKATIERSGYIASETSTATGLGSGRCPFRIRAVEGQRVRLSMVSFTGGRRASFTSAGAGDGNDLGSLVAGSDPSATEQQCVDVGTVRAYRDDDSVGGGGGLYGVESPQKLTVCHQMLADRVRDRQSPYVLYDSDTSEVIVQLNAQAVRQEMAPFVIKYEVLGCPTPRAPSNGWVKVERDSTAVTFGCNATAETWRMACAVNEWVITIGRPTNCSQHSALMWNTNLANRDDGFPYGILLVVAIGVALGIFIGGTLLSVVAFCMKKRAAAEAANFNPCETESLSAGYNGCAYHLQHYQHSSAPRAIVQHQQSSALPDDRRYRTVCYPTSGVGGIGGNVISSTPSQMGPLPLPFDDYDPKCGSAGEFGKFFIAGGGAGGVDRGHGGGTHHYESPHFDVVAIANNSGTTTSGISGSAALHQQQQQLQQQQQAEMASPHHGLRIIMA